jgi:hypothetical protein
MKAHTGNFLIAGICAVTLLWLVSIGYEDKPGHECRWPKCPYRGVKPSGYEKAVEKYVGEVGTDGYCIDLLHLQYPNDEYEELEDKLFKPK